MYHIVWSLLFALNGQATSATLTPTDTYDTKAICQQYIAEYQAHVADYARGFFNLTFEDQIQVSGDCKAQERGA